MRVIKYNKNFFNLIIIKIKVLHHHLKVNKIKAKFRMKKIITDKVKLYLNHNIKIFNKKKKNKIKIYKVNLFRNKVYNLTNKLILTKI